jgi:centromeric protein E
MLDDGSGEAVRMSRLSLVDLAGSEKATSQTERRMEGSFINRSLLTLEKVIAALTEDKPRCAELVTPLVCTDEIERTHRAHIPYRDSKLTQLLQPSLCGEARVAVICTVNPSVTAVDESKSTLKFATRVKKVTLHAEKREIVDDKALITKYRSTVRRMDDDYEVGRELTMHRSPSCRPN